MRDDLETHGRLRPPMKAPPALNATGAAFTLLELLVVIAIIGILAAIGLPAIKSFGKSNATISATRQLLDDIALARQRAISSRSEVDMVFVSPQVTTLAVNTFTNRDDRIGATNLFGGQFISYALFARRQVGEQPGRSTPRYVTNWRTLPEGTFIAAYKFGKTAINGVTPFLRTNFPVPSVTGQQNFQLPYVGFDYQGRLISGRDEIIPLARGSIFPMRDAAGQFLPGPPEIVETPPGNATNVFNHVRIDWLTGRARVERREVQ